MNAPAAELGLEISRVVQADRERVYAAWTDPSQLKEWFGPEDVQTCEIIADVRVGGRFEWTLIDSEGDRMTVRGEYREVEPGRKIVFTWQWQDDAAWQDRTSVVSVELSDVKGGTEIRLTHTLLPNKQSRDNHQGGWEKVLAKLERFCVQ